MDLQQAKKNAGLGWMLNSDESLVKDVLDAITKNDDKCPYSKDKKDCKCPCNAFKYNGRCECKLFVEEPVEERERIEIAVDLETLSLRPTAAIIAIAAKAFSLTGEEVRATTQKPSEFFRDINATSCVMAGLSIDEGTCEWWKNQSDEAKKQFSYGYDITNSLCGFIEFVKKVKEANNAKEVHLWSQGTDFDIAILRNAIGALVPEYTKKMIVWKYNDVVDARTFVKEGIRLLGLPTGKPYDNIPKLDGHVSHEAMSNVENLIHNVTWVNEQIKNKIK